jgi:hypothetical protein
MLDDSERMRWRGARGREIAREKFSIEENVRQLRAVFGL